VAQTYGAWHIPTEGVGLGPVFTILLLMSTGNRDGGTHCGSVRTNQGTGRFHRTPIESLTTNVTESSSVALRNIIQSVYVKGYKTEPCISRISPISSPVVISPEPKKDP
jgi:hypothetical protein